MTKKVQVTCTNDDCVHHSGFTTCNLTGTVEIFKSLTDTICYSHTLNHFKSLVPKGQCVYITNMVIDNNALQIVKALKDILGVGLRDAKILFDSIKANPSNKYLIITHATPQQALNAIKELAYFNITAISETNII